MTETEVDEIEPGSDEDLYLDGTKWRLVPNRRDRRRAGLRRNTRFRNKSAHGAPLDHTSLLPRKSQFFRALRRMPDGNSQSS